MALSYICAQGSAQKPATSNIAIVNVQPNPLPMNARFVLPNGAAAVLTITNNVARLDFKEYPVYFVLRNIGWIKVDLRGLKKPSNNLQPL